MSVKLTVRVPRELKERMERCSGVNWSDVVRRAIEEELRRMEVEYALKVMDEMASKAKPGRPLAEVVRRFRDERR